MKLGCINSCWFVSKIGLEEGIRKIKEIGFDTIDIAPEGGEMKSYEIRKVKRLADSLGLPIVSVTAAYEEIRSIMPHCRRYGIESYKRLIDIAVGLDAKNILACFGEYIWQKEAVDPQAQWQWAVEGIYEICGYAKLCEMDVVIELEPFKMSLINSIDTMEKFLDDVNHPNCKANMDVGHLHVAHIPPNEIKRLKGKIGHVHFSDNNGTVHNDWPPGMGSAPLDKYLKVLHEVGYNEVISIELEFAKNPDKIVEWVTDAYKGANKIMQELNLRK
ncbi:sugar phosphate isomerase/epimerase [Patescibacteria group bacterium]|nr:sugar phosphate isomerase/epimerase [Patescibacteria group bacterium]